MTEDTLDPAEVSAAVVTWIGRRDSPWPLHDDAGVVAQFGVDRAQSLLSAVRSWEAEFDRSNAWHSERDLGTAGKVAAAEFQRLHPEATKDAVDALAWAYMYNAR
jgi:hypothetical protein